MTLGFTTQVTPLLLDHLGIPQEWQSPTLTLSQSMEIVSLGFLPVFLSRLGSRRTMLAGLTAWAMAFAILTQGRPLWLVIASQTLNGFCICGFIVVGQLFVNSKVSGDIRASAQALLSFMNGLGLLIGNLLVGWIRDVTGGDFPATFGLGFAIAAILVLAFYFGFPQEEVGARRP